MRTAPGESGVRAVGSCAIMALICAPLALRPDDIDAMARVLVARHALERELAPELPRAYDLDAARGQCIRLLKRSDAGALGAWAGEQLVGWLAPRWELPRPWSVDALFHRPRSVVAEHAFAPDASDRRELARRLYAAAAESWVARGFNAHYVFASAFDADALEGWFSLGFGQDQALGVRDLRPVAGATSDVEIVVATEDHADEVVRLGLELDRHHAGAPVFYPALYEHEVARGNDLYDALQVRQRADDLPDTRDQVRLARRGGQALGLLRFYTTHQLPANVTPPASVYIELAHVSESARGSGVGKALLEHVCDWGRARALRHCLVGWETANLLSDHFWRGQGFRALSYRLLRAVDERAVWRRP
jgi:ribosomal protein S18 acetylase RimI-like enzyme